MNHYNINESYFNVKYSSYKCMNKTTCNIKTKFWLQALNVTVNRVTTQ